MKPHPRTVSVAALCAALACGDSTGEPLDESESTTTGTTGTTLEPSTTSVDTGQTQTTELDTTVATSLDTSEGSTTTAADPAEIEVSIAGRIAPDGSTYAIATPVAVEAVGETITVTIENVGGSDLSIAGVALQAGATTHFLFDDSTLDPTLSPGASTSVSVAFAPQNGGRKRVALRVDNDDADEAEHTIFLEATSTPNTWRALMPSSLPSARYNMAMAASDDGRILLFGGRVATGERVADTWLFDVEAGEWTELVPPSAPSARDASAMAFVGADAVVLFGGNETSGPGVTPLVDTWIFDVAAETWTELTPPTSPSARYQHAMVSLSDGTALLQGGRSAFGMEMSDSWQFDGATQEWTDLAPATNPGPRSAFALASDGTGRVVMVGGSPDSSSIVDETWIYDVAGNAWSMGAAAGLGAQFNNTVAWLDGDGFVTYSGKTDIFADPVPGTWAYDATADTWTDLAPESEPAARFGHRMVSVGGNKAIMFGGLLVNADFGSASAAIWEYVGP